MLGSSLGSAAATILLGRTKHTIHTNHYSLELILNPADATGILARCQLRLSEFDLDIIHRAGINNRAAEILWALKAEGENSTDIENDIPVAVTDTIGNINGASKASFYTVCQICAHEEQ